MKTSLCSRRDWTMLWSRLGNWKSNATEWSDRRNKPWRKWTSCQLLSTSRCTENCRWRTSNCCRNWEAMRDTMLSYKMIVEATQLASSKMVRSSRSWTHSFRESKASARLSDWAIHFPWRILTSLMKLHLHPSTPECWSRTRSSRTFSYLFANWQCRSHNVVCAWQRRSQYRTTQLICFYDNSWTKSSSNVRNSIRSSNESHFSVETYRSNVASWRNNCHCSSSCTSNSDRALFRHDILYPRYSLLTLGNLLTNSPRT